MPQLPVLSGKEMVRILQNLEFTITRINGSHFRLKHADGRITTIPVHGNEDLPKGLLRKIVREDLEMDFDEFVRIYNKIK